MRMHGSPLLPSSSCCLSRVVFDTMLLSASSTSKVLPLVKQAEASPVVLQGVTYDKHRSATWIVSLCQSANSMQPGSQLTNSMTHASINRQVLTV